MLVILPNPHPRALAHPSTPEVLRAKKRAPTLYPFDVFTLGSHLNVSRSLRMRQWQT
jgi:hypothetical protein